MCQSMSAQWKKINLSPPFDAGYYLDVFFLPSNPQYGWISGFNSYVLRTTDGGISWEGHIISNNEMLESIHFVTPLIGYTSGPNGVLKSTDGGISWRDVSPKTISSTLWGCFFVNQDVGMVVGGGCAGDEQSFFRTTNGGTTWNLFTNKVLESGLTDVMLYSEDGLGYASSSGIIWRTLDGGRTWSVFSQTGGLYWQEEITNIKNSFLVPISGTDCSGGRDVKGELRFSSNGGGKWQSLQTFQSMFGTFLINETTGWGVGDGALVYYTSDAGATWQSRNKGIDPGANLDDIYFTSDSVGWAVGQGVYYTPLSVLSNVTEITNTGNKLCVSPQPSEDYLQISGITPRDLNDNISIFNILGKIVKQEQINENTQLQLNISELASGVYYLRVGNETKMFVKQ